MNQEEEKQPAPPPIEPGHVMSREKFERMLKEQQK
jgi:hypothetical protein